jgi:Sec-independent protein translocase protein TatA
MEFLGIGPLELLIVLLLALVLLGPKDMAKAGRSLGKYMRKIVTSPQWKVVTQTSQELRNLPNRLIREAGLEDMQQEINSLQQTTSDIQDALRTSSILPPSWQGANTKQAPVGNPPELPQDTGTISENTELGNQEIEAVSGIQQATDTPGVMDLSAWTGTAKGSAKQTSGNPADFSAWITPSEPSKKSHTPK